MSAARIGIQGVHNDAAPHGAGLQVANGGGLYPYGAVALSHTHKYRFHFARVGSEAALIESGKVELSLCGKCNDQ
jgi:hypothetical protein